MSRRRIDLFAFSGRMILGERGKVCPFILSMSIYTLINCQMPLGLLLSSEIEKSSLSPFSLLMGNCPQEF
jgi:hypothetical protein